MLSDIGYFDLYEKYYSKRYDFIKNCKAGETYLVISPKGDVFPCFSKIDIPLGNIHMDNIAEIIQNGSNLDRKGCKNLQCICNIGHDYRLLKRREFEKK